MPGKARTLLIWFGKSERPVAATAAPAARASSGMISGTGLAQAKTMASLAMERTMSCVSAPGADAARTRPHPTASAERAGHVLSVGPGGNLPLHRVQALAALVDGALAVADDNVADAHAAHQARDGDARRAGAAEDGLDVAQLSAGELARVDERGAGHDGGSVLVVVEDGDVADRA